MRICLDTNILISAFVTTEGIASRILLRAIEDHEVVLSHYILREFNDRLTVKMKYPAGLVHVFLRFLASRTRIVNEAAETSAHFSDPKDIPLLRLLETAGVHYFVTGDKKLIALKKHKQTTILSLREALELL